MPNSFSFPDMIDNNSGGYKYIDDKESIKQNLRLLLLSKKTELLGDPYFGTNLQRLIFDPNDIIIKDLVVDEIYNVIKIFMKEIFIERKNITITKNKGNLYVNLNLIYKLDRTNDLYNIILISNEENS